MKGKTRIKIQDHLDTKWTDCFDGMEVMHEGGFTILTVQLKDESHLHGILNWIRDLNLPIISINSCEE
ncbi:hypothetical protein [Adhaeribacter soli]|uniref:Uncharacterized protein n=1 Tax=Adhaeribacter soli TaxID=2607655 RepID=A0A5N1IJQ9_9BACT|nr:hypothetical protein [Adhaeribacter soli]KAA9325648.1 hypothetical protein F0P94_17075 [Adhaeribacter soli]